eukprot:CAMPEP_0198693014 /NCGR_PEP_ID=MMETSP1468-20131203/241228_1 /TAXON_ID=1461545 /ORGANISM="Mantoniella sp, Strain CCMP1436" /LENGTH=79 /DNA_ID=CAMNT_0044447367 /DNA_START=411 /DNA_END=650 /DNA_ORIENTATION=-
MSIARNPGSTSTSLSALTPGSSRLMHSIAAVKRRKISSPSPAKSSRGSARKMTAASARGSSDLTAAMRAAITDCVQDQG